MRIKQIRIYEILAWFNYLIEKYFTARVANASIIESDAKADNCSIAAYAMNS